MTEMFKQPMQLLQSCPVNIAFRHAFKVEKRTPLLTDACDKYRSLTLQREFSIFAHGFIFVIQYQEQSRRSYQNVAEHCSE